jgi:hypothetical protein
MNLSREVLSHVTPEGITLAAIADQIIAAHPEVAPTWVRARICTYLNEWARTGRIERRQEPGRATLFAMLRHES